MRVDHVFGGHIYLISSFGNARNPLFKDDEDLSFFRSNVKKYLEEICDIFAYSHQVNQFQYLIKIKERQILEQFYYKKKASRKKKNVSHAIYTPEAKSPPESHLIVSQEVSNCLNSYAKRFNFKHKRKGGLFGDRYSKYLIESNEEMDECIERLNAMKELVNFAADWQVPEEVAFANESGECSSIVHYNEGGMVIKPIFLNFTKWVTGNLRGCFECLPPTHIKAPNFLTKFLLYTKIKGKAPPW